MIFSELQAKTENPPMRALNFTFISLKRLPNMFAKIAHFSQKEKAKCNFFQKIAQSTELQEVTMSKE